jgi:hypothetical protein
MATKLTSTNVVFNDNSTQATSAPKVWVNFSGTTGVIRGSLNVSSVAYSSVGVWTLNFSSPSPFADVNYCAVVSAGASEFQPATINSMSATSMVIITSGVNVNRTNQALMLAACFS